jgi:hypothetical protein
MPGGVFFVKYIPAAAVVDRGFLHADRGRRELRQGEGSCTVLEEGSCIGPQDCSRKAAAVVAGEDSLRRSILVPTWFEEALAINAQCFRK